MDRPWRYTNVTFCLLRSHLGIEGPVALRPGLKGKDQTLVGAVQWEREVWEQVALILHKDRRHSAGVLVTRQLFSRVPGNNSTACHGTSQESEYYHVIELDGSDVVLGQGDAAILRVDEQESLREEHDFP